MQMDAKTTWWLTFALVAVQGFNTIAWGTLDVSPHMIAGISQGVGYLTLLLTFAIHGSIPGVSAVAMPKVAVLLAAGLALLALGGPADAQAPQPFRPTGNLPRDIAATRPPPAVTPSGAVNYDGLGAQFQTIVRDVIDKAIADLSAASKDAAGQNPPDLISQPCWDAQIAFLKLLPAEWSEPPTNVGPALAIQIGRDLRRALTGDQRGTIKVDCAALFGDELAQITKLGSILGLKIATLGL